MKIYKTYLEIYYSKHRIVTKSEVEKKCFTFIEDIGKPSMSHP